jgi:hypothetical protein
MRYRCRANPRVTSTTSPRPAPASRALHRPSLIHGLPPALAHRALCISQDASMASLLLWLTARASLLLRLAALCIGQAASTASRLLLLAALCIGQDTSMASLLHRPRSCSDSLGRIHGLAPARCQHARREEGTAQRAARFVAAASGGPLAPALVRFMARSNQKRSVVTDTRSIPSSAGDGVLDRRSSWWAPRRSLPFLRVEGG